MVYTGNQLKEIVFPLGGIGTGSVGLAGNGSFVDWEILNRPHKGSINPYSCFAIRAEYPDGRCVTKILQGDHTKELMGKYTQGIYSGFGYGPNGATMCGLPHFKKLRFDGAFPIAKLTFEDPQFPAKVVLTAFNPFIPLDADNSSIPAAFFDVAVISREEGVRYTALLSVGNLFPSTVNERVKSDRYTAVTMRHAGLSPEDKDYGDMTVAVDSRDGICQTYWYRGDWQDKVTTFWYEFTKGIMGDRQYTEPSEKDVCSVGATATVNTGKRHRFRFILSWSVPHRYNDWNPYRDEQGRDVTWKNYYAVLFRDSVDSAFYGLKRWGSLYRRTECFCRSLHRSTLDPAVVDAISSTISVLKSPTVLRLEDGTFYGWEGLHERAGSCEGTCTHVWSYAYALCFLFPELERTLRHTELWVDTDENGKMQFRTELPIQRPRAGRHACVDGQMATLIKIYRDWRITGNTQWLRDNWEQIRKVLAFAWHPLNDHEWDRDCDGVLEGRQHHTLDMELFGPSSWLQGMYMAALKAAALMADALGKTEEAAEYRRLFAGGYRYTKENLFNGRYFYHKVELDNKGYIEHYQCPQYWNEEQQQLKYQLGEGCEIDQMLGQWHSHICGLGDIFDPEQRKIALRSLLTNNRKESLREFANVWRVFALNDESGVIMCDYPEGSEKPVIPIPYSEECMTGFEYAFAGLLISEGFQEEGLAVVRAIRHRYDGEKRNPWNEIECGSNYARAMASFALLPILSGFTFDLPQEHIGFAPRMVGDFRCFFSLGSGWGDYFRTADGERILLQEGYLTLSSFGTENAEHIREVRIDGLSVPFTQKGDAVVFASTTIRKEICLSRS